MPKNIPSIFIFACPRCNKPIKVSSEEVPTDPATGAKMFLLSVGCPNCKETIKLEKPISEALRLLFGMHKVVTPKEPPIGGEKPGPDVGRGQGAPDLNFNWDGILPKKDDKKPINWDKELDDLCGSN